MESEPWIEGSANNPHELRLDHLHLKETQE